MGLSMKFTLPASINHNEPPFNDTPTHRAAAAPEKPRISSK
jgi:hypothetical protein